MYAKDLFLNHSVSGCLSPSSQIDLLCAFIDFLSENGKKERLQQFLDNYESHLIRSSYEDEECPDCGKPISMRVRKGDCCSNCGHVFFPPTANDG